MLFKTIIISKGDDGSRKAVIVLENNEGKIREFPLKLGVADKMIKFSKFPGMPDGNGIDTFYGFNPSDKSFPSRYNH